MSNTTYVGLDVHKDSIAVAVLPAGAEETVEWQTKHDDKGIKRLVRRLRKEAPGEIVCCYEAGPCGYPMQRKLEQQEIACHVVAPSLIPIKPGERIKTDRRDARKLARLLRAGELTFVHPPDPESESVRDLCRAREDVKEDLMRARHRLSKFLLRRGIRYTAGRNNWTQAHHAWLRKQRFERPTEHAVFDLYLQSVEQIGERVVNLEEKMVEVAGEQPYAEPVAALRCFRGVNTVTAMVIVAELHGFARFESPRALMAYLGLVPSEHSSGGSRRQGAITKTGNRHVRRVLVEAAWHYRHRPHTGRGLAERRRGQPGWVISTADRAQQRLHRRYWRLVNRGKSPNKATTAVARELVGFIWSVLYPMAVEQAA